MAGSSDQGATADTVGAQITQSTQIYYHPEFKRNTWENDIAIIRVHPPFNTTGIKCPMIFILEHCVCNSNFSATVGLIQLAKSSVIKGDALANKTTIWTSYGNFNATDGASGLMTADIKPIKSKACEAIYRPGPFFVALPKTIMCMEPSTTIGMCMVCMFALILLVWNLELSVFVNAE